MACAPSKAHLRAVNTQQSYYWVLERSHRSTTVMHVVWGVNRAGNCAATIGWSRTCQEHIPALRASTCSHTAYWLTGGSLRGTGEGALHHERGCGAKRLRTAQELRDKRTPRTR